MSLNGQNKDETPLALVASARRGRLSLLDMLFSVRGYSVVACQNGPEVLEVLKTSVPELAVLDHDLPGMNGREICSRMRLIEHLANVPVALVMPSLDELGGVAEFEEFARTTRADIVVAEPLGKRNLVDHLETLLRERKATTPNTERAWSPPVMLPAPSSVAASSSLQEAIERGELGDVNDPDFDLDLLPGEVVLTEPIGEGRRSQRATEQRTGARPQEGASALVDREPDHVERLAGGSEAKPADNGNPASGPGQNGATESTQTGLGRSESSSREPELEGAAPQGSATALDEADETNTEIDGETAAPTDEWRESAGFSEAEYIEPSAGQEQRASGEREAQDPDLAWSEEYSPAAWDPRDGGIPVPPAAERGVPDVEEMSARIAEALRQEEMKEQTMGMAASAMAAGTRPDRSEERAGVQTTANNSDLLTIGTETLERMDGVDTVREENTNVQALLERRDIMQALIEEQAERINSLQQRNVALRRELDQQKAKDTELQEELDNLKALIQEQNETVETLQERNVALRQELDQHKADNAKRDSELEYLRKYSKEQADTIAHFQQVAEVLWQELEQRKADEAPLRDFLQRLLDRDQHANFESLRDDMRKLRRRGENS